MMTEKMKTPCPKCGTLIAYTSEDVEKERIVRCVRRSNHKLQLRNDTMVLDATGAMVPNSSMLDRMTARMFGPRAE